MICKIQQCISPFRYGGSFPSRGWDNHGLLNYKGGSSRAYGTRIMDMDWGRDHVSDFSHMLIIFCPNHLLHFVIQFLVESGQLCFFFFFQLLQPPGHQSSPDPRWGQGDREVDLMWTEVGEMMNGGIVSQKGIICGNKGAGPRTQSRGFPSSTTLEPNGQ